MAYQPTLGYFTTQGWTANDGSIPGAGLWATATSSSAGSAQGFGGFTLSYDPSNAVPLSQVNLDLGKYSKFFRKTFNYLYGEPLLVTIANTGYTDSIIGGSLEVPSNSAAWGVGLNYPAANGLAVLNLQEAASASGNRLTGYGSSAGIRVNGNGFGVYGVTFRYSAADRGYSASLRYTFNEPDLVLGGDCPDVILGQPYGIGQDGIVNYGGILTGGDSDSLVGDTRTSSSTNSVGIYNNGFIDTGTAAVSDSGDEITGYGTNNAGIWNDNGIIATGLGDDVIWGQTTAGAYSLGINNISGGLIDMGPGNDNLKSTYTGFSGNAAIARINSSGSVIVMGLGSDVVTGFGTGYFFGDELGAGGTATYKGKPLTNAQAVGRAASGKALSNFDSLVLPYGTYTVTALSGKRSKVTIGSGEFTAPAGYKITNGSSTMRVYGFESFGPSTDPGGQIALAAGTLTFQPQVVPG